MTYPRLRDTTKSLESQVASPFHPPPLRLSIVTGSSQTPVLVVFGRAVQIAIQAEQGRFVALNAILISEVFDPWELFLLVLLLSLSLHPSLINFIHEKIVERDTFPLETLPPQASPAGAFTASAAESSPAASANSHSPRPAGCRRCGAMGLDGGDGRRHQQVRMAQVRVELV